MTGVGEGAGATARVLEVLKDLPLWVLIGLAGSAALLLFVPVITASVPKSTRPWIVLVGVVCAGLSTARATGLFIQWVRAWRASAAARQRFFMTAISRRCHWSRARQSDDSVVTQVAAHLLIKNLEEEPLSLVSARLIKPSIRGEVLSGDVYVRAVDRDIYGSSASGYMIPANMSLEASTHIMIRGVPRRNLDQSVRATIGVTDDEGHEQRITITMRVLPEPQLGVAKSTLEVVSSIPDPIEREVAAVLQAELGRYDKCGRRVGGLGSVHLVIIGRELIGVGPDSWNPNSPRNQSISDNPDVAELRSDNLEALMAFHTRLTLPGEQDRFRLALLSRIGEHKGYLRVSYFIVCALWKVGELSAALQIVKAELPRDEIKVFGLSNVLMVLNGLLRYRHPDFSNSMLDEIEMFVHDLNEHPFQIPEKIAAIRAFRLLGSLSR